MQTLLRLCGHHSGYKALRPSPAWIPSLYDEDSGEEAHFDRACTLTLLSLGDDLWDGHSRVTEGQRANFLHSIERYVARHTKVSGNVKEDDKLTWEELEAFLEVEEHREEIRHFPTAMHGLLDLELVREAFKSFDRDESGEMDVSEWNSFLDWLEVMRLQYLQQRALIDFRSFFARGQTWCRKVKSLESEHFGVKDPITAEEWTQEELLRVVGSTLVRDPGTENGDEEAPTKGSREPQRVQGTTRKRRRVQLGCDQDLHIESRCGIFPVGWWEDMYYYSANVHPLHGIFACDRDHPLSKPERLAIEVATVIFAYFTCALREPWVEDHRAPVPALCNSLVFSIVVVTIPKMLLWKVLYILFTCPACHLDRSTASPGDLSRASSWRTLAALIGYFMMMALIGVLMVEVLITQFTPSSVLTHKPSHVWATAKATIQAYIFSWAIMLLFPFNLFIAVGRSDVLVGNCCEEILDLGSWRIQKQRVQLRCLEAAKKMAEEPRSTSALLTARVGGKRGISRLITDGTRACDPGTCAVQ